MSLRSHLADKNSPVRKFLSTQFSDTQPFLKDARKRLRGADTIQPSIGPKKPGRPRYPWNTIGMALDYRIRYYFDVTPHDQFVAYRGARELTDGLWSPRQPFTGITDLPADIRSDCPAASELGLRMTHNGIEFFERETLRWLGTYRKAYMNTDGRVPAGTRTLVPQGAMKGLRNLLGHVVGRLERMGLAEQEDSSTLESVHRDFFEGLDEFTTRNRPVATRLTKATEDELNRHCVVLALFEEAVRTGHPNLRILANEYASAGDLLDIPESHWIDDLRNLSWSFCDNYSHLLLLPYSLNPTFDGSRDVGGADADLIVNSTLIDIKATIDQTITRESLLQLLGYVLLDYSDRNRINGIGLYMARQGILFQWDLAEAIRGLCPGQPPSVDELRSEFKVVAKKAPSAGSPT